jgi:hypothetical protein
VEALIEAATRPSTKKSIQSRILQYTTYCNARNLEAFPRPAEELEATVLLFAGHLCREKQLNTVLNYVSAVRIEASNRGLTLPTQSEWPRLRKLLKGAKETQVQAETQAFAPSIQSLRKTLAQLPKTDRGRVFRTALLLQFWSFARLANVLQREVTLTDGRFEGLKWSNIHLERDRVEVTFDWTKTTFRRQSITIPRAKGNELCLVRNLTKISRNTHQADDLVCQLDGKPYRPDQFRRDYKKFLTLTVEDCAQRRKLGQRLSPHGLRAAGCTFAMQADVPEAEVREQGVWTPNSKSFKRYVRTTPTTVGRGMVEELVVTREHPDSTPKPRRVTFG